MIRFAVFIFLFGCTQAVCQTPVVAPSEIDRQNEIADRTGSSAAADSAPQVLPINSNSFWSASVLPAVADEFDDSNSVTLGLQFYSDVPGSIYGLRFYKGPNNTGTHIGTLWSGTGTKLAEITFTGETASGWQQALFTSPVSISASTNYVISYLAPQGNYAVDSPYAWSSLTAAPLHFSNNLPGVYQYGGSVSFPRANYQASNYWVAPIFASILPGAVVSYSISGAVTGSPALVTLSGTSVQSTKTDSSGRFSFGGLANGSYVVTASQPGYNLTPSALPITIHGASAINANFTATVASHSVVLTWIPSTSPNISGYNVYRVIGSEPSLAKLTGAPVAASAFVDTSVVSGQTYYYVATAVDNANQESLASNVTMAVIPAY